MSKQNKQDVNKHRKSSHGRSGKSGQQHEQIAYLEDKAAAMLNILEDLEQERNNAAENEARINSIFSTAPVGIVVVMDRVIVSANDTMTRITGYGREELIGHSTRIFHGTDEYHEQVGRDLYSQFEQNDIATLEIKLIRKDGQSRDIILNATQVDPNDPSRGVTVTVQDITQRKKAESTLRDNERFLQTVFDGIRDGITVLDCDLNVLRVNEWMEEMYGQSTPLTEHKCYQVYQGLDQPCDNCPSLKAIETGQKHTSIVPYENEQGDVQGWMELSAFPLKNDAGEVTGVIEHVKDISDRVNAERQLKDSKAYLESIINSAPTGIAVLKDRVIDSANQQFCDILGYTEDELVGQSIRIIYPDEASFEEAGRLIYEQIREHGVSNYEAHFVHKDGRHGYGLVRGTPIDPDDWSKGITFTVLDITDRKEAEQRTKMAIQGGDLGTWDWNVTTGEVLFNNRWLSMLGYEPGEIESHVDAWEDLLHPDDKELVMEVLSRHLEGHSDFYQTEHRLKHKDGSWVWVLDKGLVTQRGADGKPLRVCGTHLDITERKLADRQIQENRAYLYSVLNTAPAGIVVLADRVIQDVNNQYCEIFGYRRDELIGQSIRLIYPNDEEYERIGDQVYSQIRETGRGRCEARMQTKDGRILDILITGEAIDPDDWGKGVTFALLDITDRKQAEQALSRRLKLEHLLSDISSGFVGLPTEQTFDQINQSLRMIGEDLGFEHLRLTLLTEDGTRMYLSDLYYFDSDEPELVESDDLERDQPEHAAMIREKEVIWISDLQDDLPEDSSMRQFCLEHGFISHLSIPMTVGESHIGALNITHSSQRIRFDQDLLNYLQLIADVLANAIVRQRSRTALAESELRFRSIIESSPLGVHTYDLQDDDRLVLTDTNKAAGRILGIDVYDQIGRTIEEAYPELEHTELPTVYRQIAAKGGDYHGDNFEYQDTHVGGFYEFDVFQTSPGKIAVMFSDVTKRIETQRRLQFTQYATDHAGEAVFWINEEGRFIYVNDSACNVLDYPRDELLTMSVPDIDVDLPAHQWQPLWERLRQGRFDRFEMHHQTKDGHIFPVEITANFLEYEGREYICAFARDITERKRYENAIGNFLQTVASRTGTEMFREFARQLAIQLKADMTVIGRMAPSDPETIETLAVYREGHIIENFSYPLAGTPCEQAIRNNSGLCVHTDNVADTFQGDVFLKEFGIRGYIGMPLTDRLGHPLGILSALYQKPKESTIFEEAILRVFANQAVMELQRLQTQADLEGLLAQLQRQNVELDQVRAMLQTSLEQSSAGILIADAPDVNIRFANSAALLVRGRTDVKLTEIAYQEHTKNWRTYYPDGGPYPPEELPLSRAVLNGEITENEEVVIIQEDGEQRWISANAAPIRDKDGTIEAGIVVFNDITDQKVAQQAMIESENKHRLLFTSANDAILIMDEKRFLECNPRALELYGCDSVDQILGKSPIDFSPPFQEDGLQSSEKAKTLLREAMAGVPQRFSWVHQRLDRELFYAEVALNKLVLGGRELIQAVVRDVTERRVAEKAREKLLKELSGKNEELESIVYIASHDLRSPLVNIRGFSGELEKSIQRLQKILKGESLSSTAQKELEHLFEMDIPESLHFINSGNHKLDMLLNGLLRLSRIGAAKVILKRVDMNRLFESILNNFHYKMREGRAQITVDPDLPMCMADEILISQVFTNLVDNAIKYHHPDRVAEIHISAEVRTETTVYCVADNGMGIAEDHINKIFEIFHRLHPTDDQPGEGLGLTIVRRILDRQEGKIWIESKVDVGTRVFIELPKK